MLAIIVTMAAISDRIIGAGHAPTAACAHFSVAGVGSIASAFSACAGSNAGTLRAVHCNIPCTADEHDSYSSEAVDQC